MDECDCLERLAEKATEMYGEDAFLSNTQTLFDMVTGKVSRVIAPPVEIRYRTKKKDGRPSSKWQTKSVWGEYCQFCGKRTMEAEEEKHGS